MFNLPPFPHFKETYEYGFPDYKNNQPVYIKVTDLTLDFYFSKLFKFEKLSIPFSDIVEVGFESETYRSGGKAAAGAIIGGVLTGGIGLLAGAALGGKRRKENTLQLVVKYKNEDCVVSLKPSNNMPKIYAEIKRLTSKNVIMEKEEVKDSTLEIEKFYNLMEKGIISKEEFEKKKSELLNI